MERYNTTVHFTITP